MRSSPLTMVALLSCVAPASAHARGPMVETLENGSWAASIAQLQLDLHAEGTRIHVRVTDGHGEVAPCGTYALVLDAHGARAFDLGSCDPRTGATELTLVDRGALFDHDEDGVSHPREIDICATRVENVQDGGGAHVLADSHVSCTAEVRPYLPDLENGRRVAMVPGRYQLTVESDDVRVTHDATHWTLARAPGGPSTIDYAIVDTRSGTVVLRGRVELACAHAPVTAPAIAGRALILESPPPPTSWTGRALSISLVSGLAVLRPGGVVFHNSTGNSSAADLGLRDAAGGALGLTVAYERPWLFAALTFDSAILVGERSLYHLAGSATVGTSLRAGPCGFHLGANFAVGSYQASGLGSSQLEWQSDPEFGFGAAAGMRVHLRTSGASLGVFGVDATAPIVGHQPWLVVATLGGGFGL